MPGSLWETTDHGANWTQVNTGPFPEDALRIVHDPDQDISYALTPNGLFLSDNRGSLWRSSRLREAVNGLVFIERNPPLSRAMVVGTNTGVKVSVDDGFSWRDMSGGLLAIPHTVTYTNGVLVATSDAGYFTCNTVDCAGLAQAAPAEEERGPVTVTEFYNTELGHYFITASEAEAEAIDAGSAGIGWVRTGESFPAWSLLGNGGQAMHACRFYGSQSPGPNSHFFTLSTEECSALIRRQARTPDTNPRWNFEGCAFSATPAQQDAEPCLAPLQPVYRAYNQGFRRGEDSNHRYVTDRSLFDPMIAEGWVDEGVAFCVPGE